MELIKDLLPPLLTEREITWLRNNYPRLHYFPSHKLIYGVFEFDATFKGERIIDRYVLSIDLTPKLYGGLPHVYDDAGRIKQMAKMLNRPLIDLHNYENGGQCLIRPDKFEERYPYGISLPQFFNLLTSHFFWLSYMERFNKEPWEGEKHGWEIDELKSWMQRH